MLGGQRIIMEHAAQREDGCRVFWQPEIRISRMLHSIPVDRWWNSINEATAIRTIGTSSVVECNVACALLYSEMVPTSINLKSVTVMVSTRFGLICDY